MPNDISALSPLGYWRAEQVTFDGTDWTLIDQGSGGNNGTSVSMPLTARTSDVPLFDNKSFAYDGVADYVDCGSTSYLQNLSEFSVSLWAKQTTATNTKCIIGDWGFDTDGNFAIETGLLSGSATKLTFYIKELSGAIRSIQTQNYVFTGNVWNHIVITFNSGTPNIYVNGTAQGLNVPSLPTSLAYGNGTINIGRFRGLGRNFNGTINDTSLFNTELTQEQVTQIYNGGIANNISNLNPLSYWRSEFATWDGSNWTMIDQGSGANNGTSVSMPLTSRTSDVPT